MARRVAHKKNPRPIRRSKRAKGSRKGYDWVIQLLDLRQYLRTGKDLVAGAVEIVANRLARAAEMMR
jgi:hypothetical protein